MEQRRPRLGDVVDDYCPRERRLSNHVVVAMVGDAIKQTRCTTCDAEHIYKNAKVPPKRKKADSPAALVQAGGRGLTEKPRLASPTSPVEEPTRSASPRRPRRRRAGRVDSRRRRGRAGRRGARAASEDGPVHRPLIRATLPRVPGEEREPRPIPEFTMRTGAQRARLQARSRRQARRRQGRRAAAKGRQDAANFRPGVMGGVVAFEPAPAAEAASRSPKAIAANQPRPQGHKKSR